VRAAIVRLILVSSLLGISRIATGPQAVHAQGRLQTLAVPGGQPDDITTDPRGRLLWGNLSRGTIERLQGGRVVTVARGLSVPEGVLAFRDGSMIVAEQGPDRIDRIGPRGRLSVLYRLTPVAGQEGVDGIGWDAHSHAVLIPDSPRGTVLRYTPKTRRTRVLTTRLGRPVDAALDHAGNLLVPDEHLGTLAVIGKRGHVTFRGRFSTPDDVAVDRSGRIWVTTLGDNALWSISPNGAQHLVASGLQNPQGMTLDRCGDPIVVEQGAGRIVRVLLTARSRTCRF
jgi:sugar lactone lactonase YvrE